MNDAAVMFAVAVIAALGWMLVGVQAFELRDARKQLAKFDRDGDGRVGGSRPRTI